MLWLTAPLAVFGGAFTGYAAGQILDVARRGYLVAVDSPGQEGIPMTFFLQPVAVLALWGGFMAYRVATRRCTAGAPERVPIGPWTLTWLGVTLGLAWQVFFVWAPADQFGASREFLADPLVPWTLREWALYALEWVVVPAAAIMTAIALVRELGAARRDARHRRSVAEVLAGGTLAQGVVAANDPEPSEHQGLYYAEWRVHFTDRFGAPHEVHRVEAFRWIDLPKVGQPVIVLYDAARPGDARRTFISIDGTTAPESFQRIVMH